VTWGEVYLVTTAEILGHADIKMTMRYAHPTQENMKRAVEKPAEIFDQKFQQVELMKTEKQTNLLIETYN
jgi:hypothetical protein